ncbi:MAG: OmpA family protein [Nitrospinae bacterium]|nr:OmpA family protein [Nitrospinota bacterium]
MDKKENNQPDYSKENVRIVVKKKKHKSHHGGAWKVAYADFVTALMALFIVLWLTSQSSSIKAYIGQYFTDPGSYKTSSIKESKIEARTFAQGSKKSIDEIIKNFDASQIGLIKALQKFKDIKQDAMVDVTPDGLEIEFSDTDKIIFFKPGSADITDDARTKIIKAFSEIPKITYPIIIEGHTDAAPTGRNDYTNWELSGDRANALRRIIEDMNVGKVVEVKAYGASRLLKTDFPYDASNRRVNFIIKMFGESGQVDKKQIEEEKGEEKNIEHEEKKGSH